MLSIHGQSGDAIESLYLSTCNYRKGSNANMEIWDTKFQKSDTFKSRKRNEN